MKRDVDTDIQLLQAAADPTRLAMLRQLADCGEVCACDFSDCCDVAQPTISHHLKVLRQAGWVDSERRGTWIWYWMRPDAIERFQALAGGFGPSTRRSQARASRRLPVVHPSRAAPARA